VSTSAPPITTTVGQELYDSVEPLTYADEELGWPLALYCDALGLLLDEIALVVRSDDDGNDGWSAFADPARCPDDFLLTLALWAGIRYPRRMSLSDLRPLIGPQAPGLWRGTVAAITAAVQRYLIPGGQIYFEERADGDPYKLRIFTYADETLDETALERELLISIPAGLILDYELRVGADYAQVKAGFATYSAVKAQFPTYDDLKSWLP
jgi:hypothetical protein